MIWCKNDLGYLVIESRFYTRMVFSKLRMIILSLTLCTVISAQAQYAGFKPVENVEAFKKEFALESVKVNSITSTFTQEKVLSALTEKIKSEGNFWFKRSDKVRIEYNKPFQYLMIMRGDKMMVQDGQKQNTVNVNSSKLFQQINRVVIDCVQGTVLSGKDFMVKPFRNDTEYLIELTPTQKTLKSFFQTIVLRVDKNDYTVKSIQMNEPTGDYTIIEFSNKKINGIVPDTVFNF
jgi:outer membrane lipoprotein-sorting protein